jgi:predicted KAP-like P-loop ATPase
MVILIAEALKARGAGKFLFVEFNAWLYQGYDDARAALMDVIAQALIITGRPAKPD